MLMFQTKRFLNLFYWLFSLVSLSWSFTVEVCDIRDQSHVQMHGVDSALAQ